MPSSNSAYEFVVSLVFGIVVVISSREVSGGGAGGAAAPPIFWRYGGYSDVIAIMTSS